ncbi:uncharacterized protein [Rutidosis leptorrhynchoides]|uniref:uncharacterized protein n=1 Tax=Rutidosis leptorrhynchoides TaxID=125765 RepID=UPI003A99455C
MHSLEDILKHPSEYSFCNIKVLKFYKCADLTCIFTVNVASSLTKLERLTVSQCPLIESLVKVDNSGANKAIKLLNTIFEVVALGVRDSEFNNESQTTVVKLPKLREVDLEEVNGLLYLWETNEWRQLELPNLTRLSIHNCYKLRHVFTTSMVGSLMQLQELHVTHCTYMWEIIKKDDDSQRKVLPCLKSLKLEHLQYLQAFCLWDKEFMLPSLTTLVIKQCPSLSVFTNGFVAAPKLKVIETNEGFIDLGEQDINSYIITHKQEEDNYDLWHIQTEGESAEGQSNLQMMNQIKNC